MRFAQQQYLWAMLAALPAVAGLFYWSWRVKQKLIQQFIRARLLSQLTVGLRPRRQIFRLGLLGVAVAAAFLALARPQWGFAWEEAKRRGLDIIVAIDTSRSMLARDAAPNRLERVKLAAMDLMKLARNDRLGLVAFAGSAFLQPLRDSEFLSAIKHRSAIPGGTCEFDLPDYYYWLAQSDEPRIRTFNQWLGMLRPLCDAIAELLWLTRQNGRTREEKATAGLFHITFDRDSTPQLLRISLPVKTGMYPEISGSHYRCSVRFLKWNGLTSRPTQTDADVPFVLSCCG